MILSNFNSNKCLKVLPNSQSRTKIIKPSSIIKTKDGIPFSIKSFTDIGLRPVSDLKKKKIMKKKKKLNMPEEKLPDVSKLTNPLKNIFTPEMTEVERFEVLGKLDFKMTPGTLFRFPKFYPMYFLYLFK